MKVVVAEDSALLRDGVRLLLTEAGLTVVAAVADADALLVAVADHGPDLAVIDVRMPPDYGDEGVRAAITIRERHPDTGVLVFSQWVETTYARRLIAMDGGGYGYLLKDRILDSRDFVDAARRVAAGGTVLDPDVVRQLLGSADTDEGLDRLTDREGDVLRLVAEGRSNQAIADNLHLSVRSVEKVITSIFQKLDLAPADSDHRRVLTVLRHLGARHH